MAKEPNAPEQLTMSMDQLLELVRTAVASNTLDAEAISSIAAKAATESSKALRDQWWDERTYPGISAFNPLGEKAHPRPELEGEIYWIGARISKEECTREEIELLNQLRPGHYTVTGRDLTQLPFTVVNLEPGNTAARKLLVLFPSATADQRTNLTNMREMLREVLKTTEAPAAVPA